MNQHILSRQALLGLLGSFGPPTLLSRDGGREAAAGVAGANPPVAVGGDAPR